MHPLYGITSAERLKPLDNRYFYRSTFRPTISISCSVAVDELNVIEITRKVANNEPKCEPSGAATLKYHGASYARSYFRSVLIGEVCTESNRRHRSMVRRQLQAAANFEATRTRAPDLIADCRARNRDRLDFLRQHDRAATGDSRHKAERNSLDSVCQARAFHLSDEGT